MVRSRYLYLTNLQSWFVNIPEHVIIKGTGHFISSQFVKSKNIINFIGSECCD